MVNIRVCILKEAQAVMGVWVWCRCGIGVGVCVCMG